MKLFGALLFLFTLSGFAGCIPSLRKALNNSMEIPPEIQGISYSISLDEIMNPRQFLELNQEFAKKSEKIRVFTDDISKARSSAYNFPLLKELGFENINAINDWEKYASNLEKSDFYGLNIGWTKKLENGNVARIRIDWDKKLGGHYDLEFYYKDSFGQNQKAKASIAFGCNGKKCTQKQIRRYVNSLQKNQDNSKERFFILKSEKEFLISDTKYEDISAYAHKTGDGSLDLVFNLKNDYGQRSPYLRGKELFKRVINHFENDVSAINGKWEYGDNLKRFNELSLNMSPEEAAKLTWTGERAQEYGFTKVKVVDLKGEPGNFSKVFVQFTKE